MLRLSKSELNAIFLAFGGKELLGSSMDGSKTYVSRSLSINSFVAIVGMPEGIPVDAM
jgi:hypothetical protein